MSYTIREPRETADSAPKFGFAEMGEAHFPREELGAEATGLAYQVLKPGKRQAFGHRHDEAEEVYVVLVGQRARATRRRDRRGRARSTRSASSRSVTRAFEAGPDGLAVAGVRRRATTATARLDHEFWKD